MIQVYSQEKRMEKMPVSQYYLSKDTYQGVHFEIKEEVREEFDVLVRLHGTCTAPDDSYAVINLTWPIQPEDLERIRYVASVTSGEGNFGEVHCGFTYSDETGAHWVFFEKGRKEMDFHPPEGCRDIRLVLFVSGKANYPSFTPYGNRIYAELYYRPPDTEDYLSRNGDMTVFPTSASVHAVLNGVWEAALEHPIDPEGRWKYLAEENIVKMPSFNGEQLFRIKNREKSDSGITCEMEPIFYDTMGDCWLTDVRPTKKSGQEALDLMLAPNQKYSARSDITRVSTAYYQYKNFLEALNGDDPNSFVHRWGGEILFDNFEVVVNDRVGGDYGVELRYGKNIPRDGLTEEADTRDIVTRIYPKAYNGHTMKDHGYVDSPLIGNYPTVKTAAITFDDVKMAEDAMEDDADNGVIVCKNQTELDAALKKRCMEQFEAGLDKPKVTIEADMVLLQDTDLYKDYQILETVGFGDTVHCRHSRLGITTDARVIELEYDCLRKKVGSVVLGDFRYDYFDRVSSSVDRIDGAIRPDGSVIAEKIAGFIDGAMASLRAQYNVAEKQDVLAIRFENLDEESPLYGSMALGTQGLMISKQRTEDGRDWDWTTALTANGLVAGIIVAGILSDQTGKSWWDLDKGEIHLEGGYFSGTIYAKDGVFSGEIRSSKGKIGGWTITENGLSNGNVHIYSTKYVHDDEDFSDGSPETVIYLDGIKTGTVHATEVHGYLHDLWAYTGEIPIVTKIEKTGDGGIQWTHSTIKVEDGIIKNAPRSEVVYDGR